MTDILTSWSFEAWQATTGIYEKIITHPFVTGMIDGTLPRDRFIFYIEQDSLYLQRYFKVLAHIASRVDNASHAAAFMNFATDGIAVEEALHESLLAQGARSNVDKSPTCTLYTSTLLAQSLEPVEVEAAAVLPCFWIYQRVGEYIFSKAKNLETNPYREWIQTYADERFARSTQLAISLCNEMAAKTTPAIRHRMTDIYTLCSRLEWMFWDSAWNLEHWKI